MEQPIHVQRLCTKACALVHTPPTASNLRPQAESSSVRRNQPPNRALRHHDVWHTEACALPAVPVMSSPELHDFDRR